MAFKLPKLFSATDTKSRIFLLVASVLIGGLLIVFAVRFLSGNSNNTVGHQRLQHLQQLNNLYLGQLFPLPNITKLFKKEILRPLNKRK